MKDGKYITRPKWSPINKNNVREVLIENGIVKIDGHFFTIEDFFKVNDLVKDEK